MRRMGGFRLKASQPQTGAADAEAICEAVTRPTMRFVPVKTAEQQAVLVLNRTRDLLARQHTALVNALRGHLAEFGIVAPQGMSRVAELLAVLLARGESYRPRQGSPRLADA
jgi:transposase